MSAVVPGDIIMFSPHALRKGRVVGVEVMSPPGTVSVTEHPAPHSLLHPSSMVIVSPLNGTIYEINYILN